ncbi:Hypothetical predicted protein [Octopus vulgaris]|uniref:Uncharacterized protein n=1 Tax=Octopus vulgaris TaxID=6645 RepID=A0AA36FRJ3_OCTVU|nr:Hypothetical predicted protein [Octopus vulgaris]
MILSKVKIFSCMEKPTSVLQYRICEDQWFGSARIINMNATGHALTALITRRQYQPWKNQIDDKQWCTRNQQPQNQVHPCHWDDNSRHHLYILRNTSNNLRFDECKRLSYPPKWFSHPEKRFRKLFSQIMDILKSCLFALFYLASAASYKIIQSGPAVLNRNLTLSITISDMKRPVVWKCDNYKYECDRTCANGTDYKVTHSGDTSKLWIRKVTKKCSTWKFEDDNLNIGRIDLEIKSDTTPEASDDITLKSFGGGAQGTSSLRTKSILVIGMITAVIIYTF